MSEFARYVVFEYLLLFVSYLKIFHCCLSPLRTRLPASSDVDTLPQPMIDDGIDLHSAEACRLQAVSVSRIFQPDPANGNLHFSVIYELASLLSLPACRNSWPPVLSRISFRKLNRVTFILRGRPSCRRYFQLFGPRTSHYLVAGRGRCRHTGGLLELSC